MASVAFLILLFVSSCTANLMNPFTYSIVPVNLTVEDTKYLKNLETNIFKVNGETFLNLTTELLIEFPARARLSVLLMMEKDGVYEMLGQKMEHNLCNYLASDKFFYPGLLKYSNFVKSCPVKVGKYAVVKYKMPVDTLPPVLPTGNVKLQVNLTNNGDTFMNVKIFATIVKNF